MIDDIDTLVDGMGNSLDRALQHYWPVANPERNGLQEANLTYHFAAQCLAAGLYVYPEASHGQISDGHKRVDLLVRGSIGSQNASIIVESKKLFSSEKAASMAGDIEKINGFVFPDLPPPNEPVYGLLLAITENPENAEWWDQPYECGIDSWDFLMKSLARMKAVTRVLSIKAKRPQFILTAIYQRDVAGPMGFRQIGATRK